MRIRRIAADSPAAAAGLAAGDDLCSINGTAIRDSLDFLFASADERLRFTVRRAGRLHRLRLSRGEGEDLGIELEPDPIRRCGNRCVFCFIDQNPEGLRPSLYIKDEDYRLSIFYGNYLTLTNLREEELLRILDLHLSPLYVSVHATDPNVRQRLLRCPGSGEIVSRLKRLAAGGIQMHTQIVLVPGYNDGAVLARTLDELEALHPAIESVALVPVGLTRHRAALTALRGVTAAEAGALIDTLAPRQARCQAAHGTRLFFLADEFYLLGRRPLPPREAYEDLAQIENGVGMVRHFEEELMTLGRLFPPGGWVGEHALAARPAHSPQGPIAREPRHDPQAVRVVTGERFAPLLGAWLPSALARTGEADAWSVEVRPVRNRFYGPQVNVAGLLTGSDLLAELAGAEPRPLVLPPEMFNRDAVTLDGWDAQRLAGALEVPVRVGCGEMSAAP